MEWTFSEKPNHTFFNDVLYIWIPVPKSMLKEIQKFIAEMDKPHTVTIKPERKKRSLNANAYSWALTDQLADALRISKEECHFLMLKRYGQKTVVSVVEEGIPILEKAVDYFEQFAESEMNGKTFYHYKVWKGSHEFDTREMSIFLDGIISECKEQGIPTETPAEIERMKALWGKEKG